MSLFIVVFGLTAFFQLLTWDSASKLYPKHTLSLYNHIPFIWFKTAACALMGFLLSLTYNINRYMLEHKVLTNYYSARFYSFAGKIPCVFPIHSTRKSFRICRVWTHDDEKFLNIREGVVFQITKKNGTCGIQ